MRARRSGAIVALCGGALMDAVRVAGPVIVSGIALGIAAVHSAGVPQLDDTHKKWGIALLVLYAAQCSLGALIHWVKPSSWTVNKKRPMQNYLHAVFGLLIIGLAFYQVSRGRAVLLVVC